MSAKNYIIILLPAGDYIRDIPLIVGTAHIPGWRVDSKYDGDLGYNNSLYVISTYMVANDKEYVFIWKLMEFYELNCVYRAMASRYQKN